MNELARKQARRVELERTLLNAWGGREASFAEWLYNNAEVFSSKWEGEAIELIALYGE